MADSGLDTSREVFTLYHTSLSSFLDEHLSREQGTISAQRQSARDKLTRLAPHQFQELATDVFDEMKRRLESAATVPFLPVQAEFHPKRNQARQKLATLSDIRFKDLASDVFVELERRHPELKHKITAIPIKTLPNIKTDRPGPGDPFLIKDIQPAAPISQPQMKSNTTPYEHRQKTAPEADGASLESLEKVDFKTLDNLMADLGSLIATDGSSAINAHDKDVNELKLENGRLSTEVEELKRKNENFGIEVNRLQRELSDAKAERDKQFELIQNMKREHETEAHSLRDQVQELQATISSLTEKIDSATMSFNREIRQLSEEKYSLDNVIKRLENEKSLVEKDLHNAGAIIEQHQSDLRATLSMKEQLLLDLEEARNEITSLNHRLESLENNKKVTHKNEEDEIVQLDQPVTEPPNSQKPDKVPSPTNKEIVEMPKMAEIIELPNLLANELFSPNGLIQEEDLRAFTIGIQNLLQSVKENNPASVLVAMKSIVVATKSFAEKVESFESDLSRNSSESENYAINGARSQLSTHLTLLMTYAKSFAMSVAQENGGREEHASNLERGSHQLTCDILDLTKLIKIRVSTKGTNGSQILADAGHSPPSTLKTENESAVVTEQKEPLTPVAYPIHELQVFLEQQTDLIVRNIQSLLQYMRQSSFGTEFKDTISGIDVVVENLVVVSRETLNNTSTTRKERGADILQQLIESNKTLQDLSSHVNNREQAPSKQKLAAAAYEVAKHTKELVGLFESG